MRVGNVLPRAAGTGSVVVAVLSMAADKGILMINPLPGDAPFVRGALRYIPGAQQFLQRGVPD
jgi:hypothetical protein